MSILFVVKVPTNICVYAHYSCWFVGIKFYICAYIRTSIKRWGLLRKHNLVIEFWPRASFVVHMPFDYSI